MFVSRKGLPVTNNSINYIIKKYACKNNQINILLSHFRVALLLRLYNNGMGIDVITYFMGYKNLNAVFQILRMQPSGLALKHRVLLKNALRNE